MSAVRQREPRYRSNKLLKAANGAPCGICGSTEGVVAAHSNALRHGHGIGHKSHDYYCAYLCQWHHDQIDGRLGKLTKEEKRELWQEAHEKTLALWFTSGIVRVV